jgi:hypothetical protein
VCDSGWAQPVVLASAAMGTPGKLSGTSITAGHFSGWRFEIDTPMAVERVGGHIAANLFLEGDIFAALIALDSIASFPHGSPFTSEEVIATTTFRPPVPSDQVLVPLNANLAPGSYALVFGSNLFGATGEGMLPLLDDQLDIPPTTISSYIFWSIPRQGAPPEWRTNLAQRMRFVVEGQVLRIPGDYNLDGAVDQDDYEVWRTDFGSMDILDADGNDNNIVDAADFKVWRDHLGTSVMSPPGVLGVPEPAAAVLVIVAAVVCLAGIRPSMVQNMMTR